MVDYHEKIRELEDSMAKAKYNKRTEHWFGLIKSQIATLREKIEKRMGKKGAGKGWSVKKTGNATVILVGFPSVGKSTLLNALTGTQSKTAAYEFTTLDCIPGTLNYKHAKIQILDVPGVIEGAAMGRGRGKEVLATARTSDLVLFVIDATHPEHYPLLRKEIFDVGVRVDEKKPDVKIIKKPKGGLSISTTVNLDLERETLRLILKEFKMINADVVIRDNVTIDQFIDSIEGNRAYNKALICITKEDLIDETQKKRILEDMPQAVFVSAEKNKGIGELKEEIYKKLDFAKIYLKEVNKKPDMDVPLVLKQPVTVKTVCQHIHRDFIKKFRFARIWGSSAKFPGQQIRNLDKELKDETIVEVHVS